MSRKITAPFIGVRLHENRTPTGKRTQTPAKRAALYVAYGSERTPKGKEARLTESQRGEWLSPDGRVQPHDEVMTWVRAESFRHRYTFETILSVRDGDLTGEAFCKAMGQGEAVSEWRLMMHNDTNNRHAHVLFFGDKRMEKKIFLTWQAEVRAELVAQEKIHPDVVRPRPSEMRTSTFDRLSTRAFDRLGTGAFDRLLKGGGWSQEQLAEPDLNLSTSSRDPLSKEPALSLPKGWGMG